jgi:hypothetical protein
MDPWQLGNLAVSTVGSTVVGTADGISLAVSCYWRILQISRAIFNPLYFGTALLIIFIYAWFRMEHIAERKRLEANSRILLKKSSDTGPSLLDYSHEMNGKLFAENGVLDVINSMLSKGRKPLKMAQICQPVVNPTEAKILWESAAIRIRNIPNVGGDYLKLFEDIRSNSTLSVKDAASVASHGGIGHWRDPKKRIFSKEHTVYLSFNFHDATNFLGIYSESLRFKRMCSLSLDDFLHYKKIDTNTLTITFRGVEEVRFHDITFFYAVCLLICHGQAGRSMQNSN